MKNPAAQALGRLGGQAKSQKKALAVRQNAIRYWQEVRAGIRPAPPPRGKTKVK